MAVGDARETDAVGLRAMDRVQDRELAWLEAQAGIGVDETRRAAVAYDARDSVPFDAPGLQMRRVRRNARDTVRREPLRVSNDEILCRGSRLIRGCAAALQRRRRKRGELRDRNARHYFVRF